MISCQSYKRIGEENGRMRDSPAPAGGAAPATATPNVDKERAAFHALDSTCRLSRPSSADATISSRPDPRPTTNRFRTKSAQLQYRTEQPTMAGQGVRRGGVGERGGGMGNASFTSTAAVLPSYFCTKYQVPSTRSIAAAIRVRALGRRLGYYPGTSANISH